MQSSMYAEVLMGIEGRVIIEDEGALGEQVG